MGVVQSRHGRARTSPRARRPRQRAAAVSRRAPRIHGEEMYETRRILEVGAAGLAAERATPGAVGRSPKTSRPVRVDGRPQRFSCTTSAFTGRWRPSGNQSWRQLSKWCRRSTTSGAGRRPRARPIATARCRGNASAHLPGGAIAGQRRSATRDARAPRHGQPASIAGSREAPPGGGRAACAKDILNDKALRSA